MSPESISVVEEGRSPRARGNRGDRVAPHKRLRTIPACAGEPMDIKIDPLTGGDDPRVRGGTTEPDGDTISEVGRSPRARGNPQRLLIAGGGEGTIPACAGEPFWAEISP